MLEKLSKTVLSAAHGWLIQIIKYETRKLSRASCFSFKIDC